MASAPTPGLSRASFEVTLTILPPSERHFHGEGGDEAHHLFFVHAVLGRGVGLRGDEREAEGDREQLLGLQHGFLLS